MYNFGERLLPVPGFEPRAVRLINELSKFALSYSADTFSVDVRYAYCSNQNAVTSLCTPLNTATFLHINTRMYKGLLNYWLQMLRGKVVPVQAMGEWRYSSTHS